MIHPRPSRLLLALLIPAALVLSGCGASDGFSTAEALVDRYEVDTAGTFGGADASGRVEALRPSRYFVPEFGPREETFKLVTTAYAQQERLLAVMREHLPSAVVEKFLAGLASEPAMFVPLIDADTLRATSPVTAAAAAKRPDGDALELTLVRGPEGWKILWDFDLAASDRAGERGFMQGVIQTAADLYDRVAGQVADGSVTDLDGLWKAFGVAKPPA